MIADSPPIQLPEGAFTWSNWGFVKIQIDLIWLLLEDEKSVTKWLSTIFKGNREAYEFSINRCQNEDTITEYLTQESTGGLRRFPYLPKPPKRLWL